MNGNGRSFALSYAKDIVVAQITAGVDQQNLFELADKMVEWLNRKPVEHIDTVRKIVEDAGLTDAVRGLGVSRNEIVRKYVDCGMDTAQFLDELRYEINEQ